MSVFDDNVRRYKLKRKISRVSTRVSTLGWFTFIVTYVIYIASGIIAVGEYMRLVDMLNSKFIFATFILKGHYRKFLPVQLLPQDYAGSG